MQLKLLSRDNLSSPPFALVTYVTSFYKIRSKIQGETKFYNFSPVYVHALCMHACVGHNFSFMDKFQNNLAFLFFLRSSSAV